MSWTERQAELLAGFRAAWDAGRAAHAYLVVGPARGPGGALAQDLASVPFCTGRERPCGACEGCRLVRERRHADVLWMEPESKSRRIKIQRIREELLPRVRQTSYAGGWKVVVLLDAERLTEGAANALLKTLEEPPPRTLLLLVSERPQELLPTILSRCQRMALSAPAAGIAEGTRERLLELMAGSDAEGVVARAAVTASFVALLLEVQGAVGDEVKADASKEDGSDVLAARTNTRFLEARADLVRVVERWQRDVLLCAAGAGEQGLEFPEWAAALRRQATRLGYAGALRKVEAAEDLHRRLDRSLSAEAAVSGFFA